MTGRDLLVFGTHPFEAAVPLGDWQLARALARHHRVLWVDPPASPVAPLRGAASRGMFRPMPRPAGDGLLVGSPVVPSGRLRPSQSALVDRLVSAQVRRWMRGLGMAAPDVITFWPRAGALERVPRRSLTVWLKDRDWVSADVGAARWLRDRVDEVVRAADVVTVVSGALLADCQALGVDAVRIPNGCDLAEYATRRPEPSSLRGVPTPRVVFSGAWNWRVDGQLVAEAAVRRPELSFVLVGAASDEMPAGANVHRLGAVAYAELAAHLQACAVGIVPYRAGPFNEASCPLKVYEYLAAGLPVVASGIDTAGLPPDLVRRVDGVDVFVAAIDELACGERGPACRREAARHSWDARAAELLAVIDARTGRTTAVAGGRARA